MSIQAISFGATTKNGNQYKKTHAGTIAGVALGTAYAAYDIKKSLKKIETLDFKRKLVNEYIKARDYISKEEFLNIAKKIHKAAFIVAPLVIIGAGLGIGALVNKAINKSRAAKADAAAQQ